MPLSEHEQKMLEQMEQALAAEDPKFASQMQGSSLASLQRRRWLVGAVGVIAGLALVLVGVNTTMWVGAGGFALMVASAVFAATPPRRARLGVVRSDGTTDPRAKGGKQEGQELLHGPPRRALGAPPEQLVSRGSPRGEPRPASADATTPATYSAVTARPAASSMPMLCSTATSACLVRVQACDPSRLRPSSTTKMPSTNPTIAPTTGITKKPTIPKATASSSVDELHPALAHPAPGEGVLQHVARDR